MATDTAGNLEHKTPLIETQTEIPIYQISLPAIAEDTTASTGVSVSVLLQGHFSDPDANSKRGIALTTLSGSGSWQYSLNGFTWTSLPGVSESSALLLADSHRLRFLPAANWTGTAAMAFRAWDMTQGTSGARLLIPPHDSHSSISRELGYATLAVFPVNDRPVFQSNRPMLLPVPANGSLSAGQTVASMGHRISDVDGDVSGIAITAASGPGSWQFSTDNGNTWEMLSAPTAPTATAARLLGPDDWLRFVPNDRATGAGSITYKAWDRSSGIRGSSVNTTLATATAFSIQTLTVSARINNAPILTPTAPISRMPEDASPNAGIVISSLLTNRVADDLGALSGIAITDATTNSNGVWQFSLNGQTWQSLGNVSVESALLLRSTDRVRFLPAAHFNGGSAASFSYRAWDQTYGLPATWIDVSTFAEGTFFSQVGDTLTVNVESVNDRPVMSQTGTTRLAAFMPGDTPTISTVAELLDGQATDVDDETLGLAITALTGKGIWQYSSDNGGNWQAIGTVSFSSARLLSSAEQIRFLPDAGYRGSASFTWRAWDGDNGLASGSLAKDLGSSTAYSTVSRTAIVWVNTARLLTTLAIPFSPPSMKTPPATPARWCRRSWERLPAIPMGQPCRVGWPWSRPVAWPTASGSSASTAYPGATSAPSATVSPCFCVLRTGCVLSLL